MDKPNFALMIGKKLDQKDGTEPPAELPDSEPMGGEVDEGGAMEDSAVADLMAAIKSNSVPQAKQALKDLLQLLDKDEVDEGV
jgi:hypothetical protein